MTIRAPAFLNRSHSPSPALERPASYASPESEATANTSPHSRNALTRLQKTFKRSSFTSPAPVNGVPLPNTLTSLEPTSSLPGQYLDTVGLKFAEATSKALANPTGSCAQTPNAMFPAKNDPCIQLLKGQKPYPRGRGTALGALITSELSKSTDVHLSKAIIRTLQRPLSVLLNKLSAMLMPLLPYVIHNSTHASSGTVSLLAQAHALGIARMAAELLEVLNGINQSVVLGAGGVDHLRGIRDGLDIILKRVVEPLVGSVNSELGPILDTLAVTPPSPDTDAQAANSVLSLAAALPGTTTRLEWYTALPGNVAQSAHAALLIRLVWRALLALSSRPLSDPFAASLPTMKNPGSREGMKDVTGKERQTPPSLKSKKELPFVHALSYARSVTPPSVAAATNAAAVMSSNVVPDANGGPAGPLRAPSRTPPSTPRFGRLSLPLTSISRPPSPASKGAQTARTLTPLQRLLADTTAIQAMLGTLGKPPQGGLAQEAVGEAFEALEGFKNMLQWLAEDVAAFSALRDKRSLQTVMKSLLQASKDCPALIAVNVLVQLVPPAQLPRQYSVVEASLFVSAEHIILNEWRPITISELLGMSDAEYHSSCLTGFGRADAAVEPVGRALLSVLQPSINASEFSSLVWDKGVDLRVLQGWLAERIVSNDDAHFVCPADNDTKPNPYAANPRVRDVDEQAARLRLMSA